MADEAAQTYAVVNAAGEVVFEFEGIIKAQGLILPENPNKIFSKPSRIQWDQAGVQEAVESIEGHNSSGIRHVLQLLAEYESNGNHAELVLITTPSVAGELEKIGALVNVATNEMIGGRQVLVFGEYKEKGAGARIPEASDFLQLLKTAKLRLVFGEVQFPFTASEFSITQTVSHGLGVKPVAVVCTARDSSITPSVGAEGAITFDVGGRYRNVITGTGTGMWIAIG